MFETTTLYINGRVIKNLANGENLQLQPSGETLVETTLTPDGTIINEFQLQSFKNTVTVQLTQLSDDNVFLRSFIPTYTSAGKSLILFSVKLIRYVTENSEVKKIVVFADKCNITNSLPIISSTEGSGAANLIDTFVISVPNPTVTTEVVF